MEDTVRNCPHFEENNNNWKLRRVRGPAGMYLESASQILGGKKRGKTPLKPRRGPNKILPNPNILFVASPSMRSRNMKHQFCVPSIYFGMMFTAEAGWGDRVSNGAVFFYGQTAH